MPRPKKKEIDTSKQSIISLLQEVYNELVLCWKNNKKLSMTL